MWRGRKGMCCLRKTLREGAVLYHSVVDVMRREVGELQEEGQGMAGMWHPSRIQKKKWLDSVPWHDARSFHSSLTSHLSRMTSIFFGPCDWPPHIPEQIAANEARFTTDL